VQRIDHEYRRVERAVDIEGHPDNVGPALFGGLVAVTTDADGRPVVFRPPLSHALGLAYAAPGAAISTAAARAALPDSVPHAAAVRTAGRMAALLHGLAHADPDALRLGFADELHVPYRLPLIPGAEAAIRAGHDAGAWAVTISGAGSGLIAACSPDAADAVARAMGDAFRERTPGSTTADAERVDGTGVVAFAAHPDREGLRVERPRAEAKAELRSDPDGAAAT
ncbi:MAG: hypothetical protein ACODAE_01485, partial [Gemmatimonadota bacterium]